MMVLLVCFEAAIAEGTIFGALSWPVIATTALILIVVRPLSGWISLARHPAFLTREGGDRILWHPWARIVLLRRLCLRAGRI
jgi:hypothetical protein